MEEKEKKSTNKNVEKNSKKQSDAKNQSKTEIAKASTKKNNKQNKSKTSKSSKKDNNKNNSKKPPAHKKTKEDKKVQKENLDKKKEELKKEINKQINERKDKKKDKVKEEPLEKDMSKKDSGEKGETKKKEEKQTKKKEEKQSEKKEKQIKDEKNPEKNDQEKKESKENKKTQNKKGSNDVASGKHVSDKSNKQKREEHRQYILNKKKRNKIIAIAAAAVAGVYLLGVVLFSFVCYPNTVVADTDLSFKTQGLMKTALIPNAGEYEFNAEGLGCNITIKGTEIDYSFDVDQVVENVFLKKNPFAWPVEIFMIHDFMSESVVNYNKEAVVAIAAPVIATHNQTAVAPQNANFVCDNSTRTVSIKNEVIGNLLDTNKAMESILGYIGSGRRHLEIGENEQLLPTLYADNEKIPTAIEQANKLLQSTLTLNMSTTTVAVVDYSFLSIWVQLKEGYTAGLSYETTGAWIAELANQCNTVGKTRTFTTPYGKTVTVSGGDSIGWAIDEEALFNEMEQSAKKGVASIISVPCSSSTSGYGGPGGRDWGPRYIDVDISSQVCRMYDDSGVLIWQSDCVTGKPLTPTPTGVYTIKSVGGPTVLRGNYNPVTGEAAYASPVDNWMPFAGECGFHDASWQEKFGGDWWLQHGSKGCVNLPISAAAALRNICRVGDIVVVHN